MPRSFAIPALWNCWGLSCDWPTNTGRSLFVGASTALFSIFSYAWLRFRIGKYGVWQLGPVIHFIFGLLYIPVAGFCGFVLVICLAPICPDSVGELLAPVVLIGSFCGYLEILRFFSQHRPANAP